jgi:lipoate-protein ligase A
MKTPLTLIELSNKPILEQLRLEEALLRTDARNICLINRGSPPAIVMGLSGVAEELLHPCKTKEASIPVLRRFSGGGCVVVDEETLFITFLFAKKDLPVNPFPEPILRWGCSLYQEAWKIDGFHLIENDYVIGEKKCGGNAQYIQKDRWLLHTSFLWNFRKERMDLLQLPKKRPRYREDRSHDQFLCTLKDHAPSLSFLIDALTKHLSLSFDLQRLSEKEFSAICQREHRRETCTLSPR